MNAHVKSVLMLSVCVLLGSQHFPRLIVRSVVRFAVRRGGQKRCIPTNDTVYIDAASLGEEHQ